MKLAEALILRADCQKRIEQLRQRLIRSAKVQEGEQPPENPQALIAELEATLNELADLIKRINKTNSLTNLSDEMTISDALAQRDTLLLKRSIYDSLVNAAALTANRYSQAEIKSFSTVNIAELQTQMDQLSRRIRELDTRIQSANWNIDLMN
ncbi:DIP1984 family protein [Coleofasciculus sp. FACHB-1120]|uniref:DIP1984 family protein n=1 Tax=Coleofasciculus sp. FACHB-1120 TaxID=2692783 RepID=UPI0016885B70|nr:DIP1984 family protein [Coleofasciculus sp. FACHB-1120]MBD2742536.1 DIP1984 family protein [Coleofasciculus sp. FACHB-1120]